MTTHSFVRASRLLAAILGLSMAALCGPSLAATDAGPDQKAAPRAERKAAQPADPNQPNDGSDYIAAWSVMGDICQDKYPQMKPAVEEFWAKRWDQATRERVAEMKRTPEFKAKVEKHRKNLNARKDEIVEQCGRLFMGGAH